MAKNDKEIQREKLAQDIKAYLAKGGKVRHFSHGECAHDPIGQPTWETRNRPKMIRSKNGKII